MWLSCFFDKRSQPSPHSPKDFSPKLRYHKIRSVKGEKGMEVIFEVNENVLVVRLFGELDHHAAAGIREDIDRSLERCAPCDLVFDFEKVTYMDSAGIGMVLGRYRRLREAGGSVVIASCAKTVRGILHMAGIFSLMPYAQTREEAVKLLKEKEAAEWKEF